MTTPDIRDQLQATLGTAYTLESELGGGGMSRVFVAGETALGRKVVIKVLPPELAAAVSVDRFRREVQLAAQLQHPHIVPLLAAGISDGLPYYTMPLVTGESLRARLARSGELPIADTVRILRDVLSALSYAHEQGVVHRDIKPDNVLLSKHSSVVTDFGVAKALKAAADSHSSLTSIGMALGTPAYMAPEQAAADPSTDHRADIYAVGVMAYEMLTGSQLFGDRPPQQMLAAHAIQAPERVEIRRPTVPPALAALVMRALEKRPADRPQSADEMLSVLDAIATPSSISGAAPLSGGTSSAASGTDRTPGARTSTLGGALEGRSRRTIATVIGAVALVIVAGIAVVMGTRNGTSQSIDENLVVVVPFRVTGAEQSLSYLREGMLDLLAAKLTGEGGPRAADPRSVLSAWRRVSPSEREDLSQVETVRLAANLGAGQVILGGIVGTPSRMVVNATVLEVPSGKALRQAVTVEGPADSLASLVDQLTVKLLSLQAGEDQQHLAELASSSLPAIRAYLEGKAAYRQGRYEAAVNSFHRALTVDSTFALAAVGLFKSANWVGSPLLPVAVRAASNFIDKLHGADRMLAEGMMGPDYPMRPGLRHTLWALDSATKLGPGQPDVWFEHGDVMLHFGRSVGVRDAFARAKESFSRAYALDSSFAPAIEHLIEAAIVFRDTAEIRRLADRYIALDSVGDHREYVRWRAAVALGDREELARFRRNTSRLDAETRVRIIRGAINDGGGIGDADNLLNEFILERGERLEGWDLDQTVAILEIRGREKQAKDLRDKDLRRTGKDPSRTELLAKMIYSDADTTGASDMVSAVQRTLQMPPEDPEKEIEQHVAACVLGVRSARRGDLVSTREMVPVLRRTMANGQKIGAIRRESLCLAFIEGVLQMSTNPSSATAVLARLETLSLDGPGDFFWAPFQLELARLQEQRGDRAKALEIIRRRPYFTAEARSFLTTFLREEGRLAAAVGDREGAAKALRHYLVLRQGADERLRPQIDSVRELLASVETRR